MDLETFWLCLLSLPCPRTFLFILICLAAIHDPAKTTSYHLFFFRLSFIKSLVYAKCYKKKHFKCFQYLIQSSHQSLKWGVLSILWMNRLSFREIKTSLRFVSPPKLIFFMSYYLLFEKSLSGFLYFSIIIFRSSYFSDFISFPIFPSISSHKHCKIKYAENT